MRINWPNDLRNGCKLPSNLTKIIQTYLSFEEELNEFQYSFEQDEIVNIKNVNFFLIKFFGAILLF